MSIKQPNGVNWYSDENIAHAGMKASAVDDTVKTYIAEGGLEPGDFVVRGTDKEKQVKKATDMADVIGVVVHVHKEPSTPYFADKTPVGVMIEGEIWAIALGTVTAGTSIGAGIIPLTSAATGKLVKVSLSN